MDNFVLTPNRIAKLRELVGTIALEITGDEGWRILMHYGPDALPGPPDATLSLPQTKYAQIQAGDLDPQSALFSGKLVLRGDVSLALDLAMALTSPP